MSEPIRTTKSTTRLGRNERRAQIMDAALRVFADRDASDVAFEEIADAAGVSRALVYNYFGDRAGLLEAVYRHHAALLGQEVADALHGARGPRHSLECVVRAHLDFARRSPNSYRYASGEAVFTHLPQLDKERVTALAGMFGDGPSAALVARGSLSSLQSMVLQWVASGAHDLDAAAGAITNFLWRGLSAMTEFHPPVGSCWWPALDGARVP
ncbi:MAG: TetR family transcriptional regulator [Acidimicrobiales bacterium]